MYEALLQRENELRVSSNSRANNVRVVESAEVPGGPMTPTGRRTWLLSLAVGLVAAIAVAYGLDYMNDTIKTPEDVTRHLKMAFLGLVPSVERRRASGAGLVARAARVRRGVSALRTAIISKYRPDGAKIMLVHQRPAARRQDDRGRATSRWRWPTAGPACCSSTPTCAVRACTARCA